MPQKTQSSLNQATSCLKQGKVIIYPSESCYAFGCLATNKQAVEKIHQLKQESNDKPITLNISDINQIKEFGLLNTKAKQIVKKLMPGQINLIIKKILNKHNHIAKDSISFRIPKNKEAIELCKALGSAITATSVNIHGQPAIYKISEAKELFGSRVAFIWNKGDLDETIPVSTIYDTRTDKILRQGLVSLKQIKNAPK